MELTEKIRAALDEDERVAKILSDTAPWATYDNTYGGWNISARDGGEFLKIGSRSIAQHIARHDPARVLRQVAAMRKIVDRHTGERRRLDLADSDGTTNFGFYVCTACTPNRVIEPEQDLVEWPCPDVLALAEALGVEP